ncbi:hypothetical protein JCM8097_009103 [Rhodosporidiobolus ruineniae]
MSSSFPPPPPDSPSSVPHLPLELQHHILHLSLTPDTRTTRAERQEQLGRLSLVCQSWTAVAQELLFSSLAFDLRKPSGGADHAEEVNEQWRSRLTGLWLRDWKPRRLFLVVDDTNGPIALSRQPQRPWRERLVDDCLDRVDLSVEFANSESGSRVWSIDFLLSLFPRLRILSLARHSASRVVGVPSLDPDHLALARNLTRLNLGHVTILGWFSDGAFPAVKTLVLNHTLSAHTVHNRQPLDRLFSPFPNLEAAALVALQLGNATFARAPVSLKHLLIERCFPSNLDFFSALPSPLQSLTLPPITSGTLLSSLASYSPTASFALHLNRLHLCSRMSSESAERGASGPDGGRKTKRWNGE